MINLAQAREIKKIIQEARKICLATHSQPDADAIGSFLAVAIYLKRQNKPFVLFCSTDLPAQFKNYPLVEKIVFSKEQIIQEKIDVIISLDASDLKVSGLDDILPLFRQKPFLINLDHHRTNTFYGDLNLVLEEAASTSQIIFELFQKWGVKIGKETANLLLGGLITDTQTFSNPATSAVAMETASQLIRAGANFYQLKEKIYQEKPLSLLDFLAKIFQRLQFNKKWQIVSTFFTKDDLQENNLSIDELEGITNFLNGLKEGRASVLLKEKEDGLIHCSWRTTKAGVDVGRLARFLGGGGHAKAAGFTIKGKIVKMGNGGYKVV